VAFLPVPEALKGELDLRARLLAAGIDDPALTPRLDGVRSGA
jgi:hypothetical protein